MHSKKELRKSLLAARDAVPADERDALSHHAVTHLLQLPAIANATTFFTYVSVGSEVNTRVLIDTLLECGKAVAVPVCRADAGVMQAHLIRSRRDLRPGPYGIPVPDANRSEIIVPGQLDVVIVPGIAFTRNGFRLGYGGGFYDRYLAQPDVRGLRVGLTYGMQVVDELPVEETDMPVDLLCCEEGYLITARRAGGAER